MILFVGDDNSDQASRDTAQTNCFFTNVMTVAADLAIP
jgi:hypothetical protein